MGPALLLLAAAGVLGTGYLLTRKDVEGDRIGRFRGNLRQGQLYRLWVRLSPNFYGKLTGQGMRPLQIAEVVKAGVEKTGFGGTLLVTQDPSNNLVFTLITRWSTSANEAFDVPDMRMFMLEPVDEPPVALFSSVPSPLDDGLNADELITIRYALKTDNDPKHLSGFASTLSPEFPIAASLLQAKSTLVQQRSVNVSGGFEKACLENRRRYERAMFSVGFRIPVVIEEPVKGQPRTGDLWDDIEETAEDVGDALKGGAEMVTDALGNLIPKPLKDVLDAIGDAVTSAWEAYPFKYVNTFGGPVLWFGETVFKTVKAINEGKNVGNAIRETLSAQAAAYAREVQGAAPFLNLVPGIGTGLSMMLYSAASLALVGLEGQALDDAVIGFIGSQIPGGPIAQKAFTTAATFGNAMLRGEKIDRAAMNALRSNLPENAKVAFDAGYALAQGKSLKEAGFAVLYNMARGNDIAEKAVHFADKYAEAVQQGKSVEEVLLGEIRSGLQGLVKMKKFETYADALSKVNEIMLSLQKDGNLMKKTAAELGEQFGVPSIVAQAAMANLQEISDGVRIVNPATMKHFATVNGVARSPIPPAVFQLAYATIRPQTSLVVDPRTALQKILDVTKVANTVPLQSTREMLSDAQVSAVKAKNNIERAKRAIERQKWVDWYKRIMQAGGNTVGYKNAAG